MKFRTVLLGRILTGLSLSSSLYVYATITTTLIPTTTANKLSQITVPFVRNDGQMDAAVAFHASTFGGQVFVTHKNKLIYDLVANNIDDNKIAKAVSWAFSEEFDSKTGTSKPSGLEPGKISISQFKNRDPKKWKQHLASYNTVTLGEQFPGVIVNLRATANNVEKLFFVAPDANPGDIKLAIKGVNGLSINKQQQLVLATDLGDIAFTAPVAYQLINNKREPVHVEYSLLTNNRYGFKVSHYNPDYELVIDPLLASTFIGGVNNNPAWNGNYDQDIAYSVVSDGDGDSIYIGGVTQSTDFPAFLGYDETADSYGNPDGFIAHFSSDLTTLFSATYFGTNNHDRVSAIALDTDGNIVAVGQAGVGFPVTSGTYDQTSCELSATGCGFVAKFSADLSTLIASSIITPRNYPTSIAVGNGGIYFGGRTNNPNYPITAGAFGTTCCRAGAYGIREFDGFAGKISADLTTLEAMTYLSSDTVTAIAVAPDSSVYITDGGLNSITGYLARFDSALTTRSAQATYYPGTSSGNSRHYFRDVVVALGNVIAVGTSYLNDLPVTQGAYDTSCGSDGDCDNSSSTLYIPKPDGFIAKYSLDLQTTHGLTYFGGSKVDIIESVEVDSSGAIIVAGDTFSPDLATTNNAHDRSCGSDGNCNPVSGYTPLPPSDGFIAKFSSDLTQLVYSSFLGGGSKDSAYGLALLADDSVVLAGSTSSTDFSTTSGAFDTSYAGGSSGNADSDAFVSVFNTSGAVDPDPDPIPANEDPIADAGSDQLVSSRARVYLDGSSSIDNDGSIVSYRWTQISGKSRTLRDSNKAIANFRAPRLRWGRTYTLVFELVVTDDKGATASDRVTVNVR